MPSSAEGAGLRTGRDGAAVTLTLDRPGARNALDAALVEALHEALEAAATDPATAAVIVTGAGGVFCAGGDLGAMPAAGGDPRLQRHASRRLTELMDRIERLEKPVVAALDGLATGGGLVLALACDWRVGSERTRILFREGRIGLVPSHGGITRLVQQLGLARAKEILLGGEDLDAMDAFAAGLLSELPVERDLLAAAHARVEKMLQRAPLSFAAAKRLLHLAADADAGSVAVAESLAQSALFASADHREGLAAVRERRPPNFTAR